MQLNQVYRQSKIYKAKEKTVIYLQAKIKNAILREKKICDKNYLNKL